jgi:hypothetical protein
MRYAFALVAFLLVPAATSASATSCCEEIDQMAERYGLAQGERSAGERGDIAPPAPMESRGAASGDETVARGGVITPPDTGGGHIVMRPPRGTGSAMQTMPQMPPQSSSGSTSQSSTGPQRLAAADRKRIETLLSAARTAEAQGRSDQCFRHLHEARKVARGHGS